MADPTVADRNNNPGNLRDTSTGSFRRFNTPDEGYAALLNDLQSKFTGATSTGLSANSTLYDFASKYAPSSDNNNPAQYTANLANTLGVRPDATLASLHPRIGDVAQAIAKNEGYTGAKGFVSQAPSAETQDPGQHSVGGFAKNVVSSGANFLGNTAEALLHPIRTIQDVGGMAVGGLQELGGQQNENTAKFDSLKDYFGNRYGSVQGFEKALYEDPVGILGDLSAVLGVGGGAVGAVSKVGKLGELGEVAGGLNRASTLTNPLTPIAKGVTALTNPIKLGVATGLSKAMGVSEATSEVMKKNPEVVTPQAIADANNSRATIAKQVEDALQKKMTELDETGAGYNDIRNAQVVDESVSPGRTKSQKLGEGKTLVSDIIDTPNDQLSVPELRQKLNLLQKEKNAPSDAVKSVTDSIENRAPKETIPAKVKVAKNFLETQLRDIAKVGIKDGEITASGSSGVRATKDVKAIQNLYDIWKPTFQRGYLTHEEFLNLRQDLANVAKFDREFSASKPVEAIAAAIRKNLNENYRPQIKGLEEKDLAYSTQLESLNELRKGFIDKEGNLTEAATNKIANATGKGKDKLLERLEEIVPGITKKLEIQKALEDINAAGNPRVGHYNKALVTGGLGVMGLSQMNIPMIGGALAMAILSSPKIAVPLLRAFDFEKRLVDNVTGRLAKYINIGTNSNQIATQGPGTPDTISQTDQVEPMSAPSHVSSPDTTTPTPELQALASNKNFDLKEAISEGYTLDEIEKYLKSI